jgi:hypothetical protein
MTSKFRQTSQVARALWELLRYDLVLLLFGFGAIHRDISGLTARPRPAVEATELITSLDIAMSLYWRRVHCLQRSAVLTRILRGHGVDGRLVIGYRSVPFFSHAWVEVGGRVVSDSQTYKDRLCTLEAI